MTKQKIDNKDYKAIIKYAEERLLNYQKLELKGPKIVFNFIGEYIIKNNLEEFFYILLLPNYETQIYKYINNKKKIPILKVGNKITKNKLLKKLNNLKNYLKEDERTKLKFITSWKNANLNINFINNSDLYINSSNENPNDKTIYISSPNYYNNKIHFNSYTVKDTTIVKTKDTKEEITYENKITSNKTIKYSVCEFIEFVNRIFR